MIYIPLWLYYNQARIETIESLPYLHSTLVILQFINATIAYDESKIYIPLWLYYNSANMVYIEHFKRIYIPLWLYYNIHGLPRTKGVF